MFWSDKIIPFGIIIVCVILSLSTQEWDDSSG